MWCEFLPLGWTEKFTESQKKRTWEAYKDSFCAACVLQARTLETDPFR